jgi:hypothetical protein
MCRQGISVWARTARINNSVVNLNKWKQIQELFPKEVKNRLEGKPTEPIEDLIPKVKKQQENVSNLNDYVERQRLLITSPTQEPRLVLNENQNIENTNNLILLEANNNFVTSLPYTQENVPNVNDYVEIQRLLITTPIQEPSLVLNEDTNNLISVEANNNFATPLPVTQKRTRRSKVKQEINEEFTRITRSRSIRLGTTPSINAQSVETRRPIKRLTTLRR